MTIKRVQPGAMRIPANDYNQMASAAEQVQAWQKSFNGGIDNAFSNGGILIDVCNDSSEPINIYSPIELVAPMPVLTDTLAVDYNSRRPAFKGKAASSSTKDVFVISQNKILPKEIKPCLALGMTVAKVTISSAAHQYAVPDTANPGKLKSAALGICRILWKAGDSGEVWTMLQLGGSGGGDSEYNGYFKVISSGTNKIKVIDGANPEATVCGSFTAGSNISCAATELTTSGAGVVYIRIYRNNNAWDYEFGFAATLPSVSQEIYIPLASVDVSGNPGQQWTGGAITYLNGSYWL